MIHRPRATAALLVAILLMLGGLGARVLRGRIEDQSRSYTETYLDWIRKSLAPA